MNIYLKKQRWKGALLLTAIFIGATSLWYTNKLVKVLSEEEKKKVELWAEGTKRLISATDDIGDISFVFRVIQNNTTVPVILADEKGEVLAYRNLDSSKAAQPEYLKRQLNIMRSQHNPIIIPLLHDQKHFIYYRDSILLTQLRYYPYFQLGVIALFLLVSYLAFSASRRAEQNRVWIGMAKETAHQLGTPLSSLIAWVELLKMRGIEDDFIKEIEKDIHRLRTVTERFSKIGSTPALQQESIITVLQQSINYIKTRASSKVEFLIKYSPKDDITVPINIPLFEWVIENLFKNSIDAMNGKGIITITVMNQQQFIYIDVTDTGKGIPKTLIKTIFNPGYTTKNRGWGLGLSLTKRIIEDYHSGHIFVKNSEINKGTTFRIVLNKYPSKKIR